MSKLKQSTLGLALLTVALLLNACGRSAPDFVASANKICNAFTAKRAALTPPTNDTQLHTLLAQQQSLRAQQLRALRAVHGGPGAYEQLLGELSAADAAQSGSLADELAGRDIASYALAARARQLTTVVESASTTLGLTSCATSPYGSVQFSR